MILNETPNCESEIQDQFSSHTPGSYSKSDCNSSFFLRKFTKNLFTRWTDPSPQAIATYSTAASFGASQPSCNTCALRQTDQQTTLGQLIAAWWLCCSRRPSPCPHSAGPSSVSSTVRVTTSHGWQPNRVRFLHRAAK